MNLIKKAFDILDLFIDHGPDLSLEEISRLSGINKATSRRILVMLIQNGCLRQPAKRGKYSLGMRLMDFSGAIKKNNSIIEIASPLLIDISQKMNESTGIGLWDGMNATLSQFFNVDRLLKVVPELGGKIGMHCSSLGKVILAELPESEQQRFIRGKLVNYTEKTITDPNDLILQLTKIKEEGVAFDDEETVEGVRGVSVPLKNNRKELLGSIGMMGPSARISIASLKEWAPILENCAAEFARQMDYRGVRRR
jgi:IclR family transcriptional regulator, KDG regulon repressor